MTEREFDQGRFYQPYGTAIEAMYARDSEVMLSGPAGTGKSRVSLEKLHIIAEKYPGTRQLIARKTRESLSESVLVTYEDKVLPVGHPVLSGRSGKRVARRNRSSYIYPNGSEVILGGLDQITRILSTEFDRIYVPEAIEVSVADWETLKTRLRNNILHYQQIWGDTNPDADTHWIYQRHLSGQLRMIHARHEDNPMLFDQKLQDWTAIGQSYLSELDKLTGARKQRLRYGRWVGSEGVISDEIDPAIHFEDVHTYPGDWMRVWVVDFGYTNPFSWVCWAVDHDGGIHREREIYHTRRLVEDHARDIMAEAEDLPPPMMIVCDHDAEDRATLERYIGRRTVAARKDVNRGIQAVKERLRIGGNGKPRLMFGSKPVRDVDKLLRLQGRPTCLREELNAYSWHEKKEDTPQKLHDHAMDAMRYGVMAVDDYLGIKSQGDAPRFIEVAARPIFEL